MPSVCFCLYYLLLFVFVSPTLTPTRPAETVVPQFLDFALKREGKGRKHDGTEEALNRGGIEEATTDNVDSCTPCDCDGDGQWHFKVTLADTDGDGDAGVCCGHVDDSAFASLAVNVAVAAAAAAVAVAPD